MNDFCRGALKGLQAACADCERMGPKNGNPCRCLKMARELGIEYETPDWCKDPGEQEKKGKSSVKQEHIAAILNAINDALEKEKLPYQATGYDNTGIWLDVIIERTSK